MSSLWTPGGERPVPPPGSGHASERPDPAPSTPYPPASPPPSGSSGAGGPTDLPAESAEEEAIRAELAGVQRQLLEAPPEVVVANHAFGLFQLAALHLSQERPDFVAARLAIDGMGALVEGLAGRLGDVEADLQDGLAQIRLAFVQVQAGGAPTG
ncbi:MAG: hypothetical protein ACYCSJ_03450 [Acidimicrobiales bacterium]